MPTFVRLTEYKNAEEKERGFFDPKNRYEAKQEDFFKIPGAPIAYWVSDRVREIFEKSEKLGNIGAVKQGLATADNDRFRRDWQEVEFGKIALKNTENKKWFPYNSGGEFRKWYGNQFYVVNWENDGYEIKNFEKSVVRNWQFYLKPSISWSKVSSGELAFRYYPENFIFDVAGCSVFTKDLKYIMAIMNSKLKDALLKPFSQTMNFEVGQISQFPILFPKSPETKQKIDELTQECIDISKEEWDSRETSWDFKTNELIRLKTDSKKLEDAYNRYCNYWREKFYKLHQNEEELNRLFIEIYGLQDELTPDVPLEDITILKKEAKIIDGELVFDKKEIIKQFISYAVGVMFGRYSLDHKGLHIADMEVGIEEANKKFGIKEPTFAIDEDNIIPVLEDNFFEDDIVQKFKEFLKVSFGEQHFEENLRFIEDALGKSIRKYFVKDFYNDHIKRYKKRPIYWMIASPNKSFQALLYMHRYQPDIFA